ncbi:MAG: hypothetical protein RPT25_02590 [Cycloclasticus sp.]
MTRLKLCLLLLVTTQVVAETGSQRLLKNKSVLQQIKESDLEENLDVLDGYYQQLKEKMHTVDSPPQAPVEPKLGKAEKPNKPSAAGPSYKPNVNSGLSVDKLFLQAKNKNKQTVVKGTQASSQFNGRDPFAITEEMVRGDANLQASLDFLPDEQAKFTVPAMMMKGLVMAEDGNYVAVLDIEGYGSKVVRKGDTIGLQGSGDDAAIRIKEITSLQIVVEAGKVGKVIVVR